MSLLFLYLSFHAYKIYDKIEELENLIMDARAKRKTVIADNMSVDNVYKAIIYIDKMDQQERRDFIKQIISEVKALGE